MKPEKGAVDIMVGDTMEDIMAADTTEGDIMAADIIGDGTADGEAVFTGERRFIPTITTTQDPSIATITPSLQTTPPTITITLQENSP